MTKPQRPTADARPTVNATGPEVYTQAELARLAAVPRRVIEDLVTAAEIGTLDGELVELDEAVRAISSLRAGRLRPGTPRPAVFGETIARGRRVDPHSRRLSALASTTLHASALALAVTVTGVHLTTAADETGGEAAHLTRLVFVAQPGPIGGGGGGGLRLPTPPPPAERRGSRPVSSPAPDRVRPVQVEPVVEPEPPPRLANESLPTIFAPLVAAPADGRDIRGELLADATADPPPPSQGEGEGGGVGAGGGAGIGSGRGSGVGPGSGGGTGGGPYRGGSGIVPPRLRTEVRPRYTEEARQQGIEGDVLLEVVVRADGTVGDVRVVRRLGFGLDEEAVRAVRRWRFTPAERLGSPVDVLVEVAVEFTLR